MPDAPASQPSAPVAVITGASSGIGRAVALALARLGWRLCLAARHAHPLEQVADEARALGAADLMIKGTNIGIPAEAENLIDFTAEAFGRIDALINNAGLALLKPIGSMTAREIEQLFAVNAEGPAIAINRAWPVMVRNGGGRIVCVSTLGTRDPFAGFFGYAAAKCAMNSFVRSIAREGRAGNIRGFAVAPGAVETPMLRSMFDERALPAARCLQPADVADVIVACAVGQRDDMNGQTIWLEGPAR